MFIIILSRSRACGPCKVKKFSWIAYQLIWQFDIHIFIYNYIATYNTMAMTECCEAYTYIHCKNKVYIPH